MTPNQRAYWEGEICKYGEPPRKPDDLMQRASTSEFALDAAVIAGISVSDIVAGKIAETQIPRDVIDAFHAQYPHYGASFVEAVNRFHSHPERLAGLINGVKGKLFEIDYAAFLNHGHLPAGWTAELAHRANNPAWDLVIRDSHGNVNELLQAKATGTLAAAREAIAAHPHIDVVLPHELYTQAATHTSLAGHVVDGHTHLSHLNEIMYSAKNHAVRAGCQLSLEGALFRFGLIGFGVVAGQNYAAYRSGKKTLQEAIASTQNRSVLMIVAGVGSWTATLLTGGNPIAGIAASLFVRSLGEQHLRNSERCEQMKVSINNVVESQKELQAQLRRPILGV